MPAVSQAQRAYLRIHFGADWMRAHHFDNKGKLPYKKSKSKAKRKTKRKRK